MYNKGLVVSKNPPRSTSMTPTRRCAPSLFDFLLHACMHTLTHSACHVSQQTYLLSHTADTQQQTCLQCDSRHVCCVRQQTCLLCYTADMSVVRRSRHACCVTQQISLLCDAADMSALTPGRHVCWGGADEESRDKCAIILGGSSETTNVHRTLSKGRLRRRG